MSPSIALFIGALMSKAPELADNPQVTCIAENIYYEARAEPLEGLFAVAEVTNNRVASKVFKPDTHCGIIYQPHQFSWTKHKYKIREHALWDRAVAIATVTYHFGNVTEVVPDALFFHSGKPLGYHSRLKYIKQIGGHRFYSL